MPSDRDPSTPYVLEPVDPAELADPPGPPPAIDVVLGTAAPVRTRKPAAPLVALVHPGKRKPAADVPRARRKPAAPPARRAR